MHGQLLRNQNKVLMDASEMFLRITHGSQTSRGRKPTSDLQVVSAINVNLSQSRRR